MADPYITDAAWFAPAPDPEHPCMFCKTTEGHWERAYTGDEESLDGWEDWYCCHACRDAGQPCETFHRIPKPQETP